MDAYDKAIRGLISALLALTWSADRCPSQERARDAPDPRAILRKAIQMAEGIESDHVRGERLVAIAASQLDAGDRDAARETAVRALGAIDESRGLDPVAGAEKLALIARAQAKIEG